MLIMQLARESVRESQRGSGAQLGERDDLAGVHREMLHGVEHRPEHRDLSLRRWTPLQQRCLVEGGEHLIHLGERRTQPREQRRLRDRTPFRELRVAITNDLSAARNAENPHAGAAVEVQQEISDAVRRIVGTPPDVVLAEQIDAPVDFREIRAKKRACIREHGYIEHGVIAKKVNGSSSRTLEAGTIVRRRAVRGGHWNVEHAKIDRELPAMMRQVANRLTERGAHRAADQRLVACRERP